MTTVKVDAFKTALIISAALHFSLLLIPAFRSIHGEINPADYKIVQLMNLEPAAPKVQVPKAEGDISVSKDNKPSRILPEKPRDFPQNDGDSDGQFSVYLPFFKVLRLPEFRVKAKPVYPQKAKLQGKEADVLVEVYIDADGRPRKVVVLKSGGEDFDAATLEAVYKSEFTPAIAKDGKPVPVRVRIPFKFELE